MSAQPQFCDVAVPVPLDIVFTYRVNGHVPVVGGRVLVPFREKRLPGIVVELHDREPKVAAKNIVQVLDSSPVLDATLLQLGRWIAQYYIAPIGEVFRTMLPLGAEVKRARVYRIADAGLEALHQTATRGSSLRSRKSPEEQMEEMTVLSYLADREDVMEQTLRAATKAGRRLLDSLVAKKWVTREDVSAVRDARRTVEFVELGEISGKLNARSAEDCRSTSGERRPCADGNAARTRPVAQFAGNAT